MGRGLLPQKLPSSRTNLFDKMLTSFATNVPPECHTNVEVGGANTKYFCSYRLQHCLHQILKMMAQHVVAMDT